MPGRQISTPSSGFEALWVGDRLDAAELARDEYGANLGYRHFIVPMLHVPLMHSWLDEHVAPAAFLATQLVPEQ